MLHVKKVLFVLVIAVGASSAVKDFRRPSWQDDDDQWSFSDFNWKAREALREYYVNWLLNGLKREEVLEGASANVGDEDLSAVADTPAFYYTRHSPTKYHPAHVADDAQYQDNDEIRESNGPDEEPSERFESFYPDREPMLPKDDTQLSQSRLAVPESNFAFPPSDPRFFAPSVQLHVSEQPDMATTKRVIDEDQPLYPNGDSHDRTASELQRMRYTQETTESSSDSDDGVVVRTRLVDSNLGRDNIFLIALVAGCSTGVIAGLALLIYGFIRLQRKAKAAADVDYPAYGVTGPNKESTPTGDRRLAHSAQMYHYQLTKQQIIAMESSRGERRGSISEADSDDDNEEGDYTVYECPGLATTGEMEVKNPLFQDDPTPAAAGGGAAATEQLVDIDKESEQPTTEQKQQ